MKKHTSFKIQSAQRGFTLVEIVIVIALIGIIMGVVAANVFGNKERSYYKLTETQLTTLSAKIENLVSTSFSPRSMAARVRRSAPVRM